MQDPLSFDQLQQFPHMLLPIRLYHVEMTIEVTNRVICSNTKAKANCSNSLLPSNLARCNKPRVHAKMDAIGLVLVSRPFWYSRQ
jgi:hypothetical protein